MKKLSVTFFLLFASLTALTQDYTGIWNGYLTANGGPYPNTNYTLDVKTQQGDVITGRAYIYNEYYLTHEGVLDFIGDIKRNTLRITELSVLQSVITFPRHAICIKFANLRYSNRNNVSYLTGTWDKSELQEEIDCIPGNVVLKKVVPGHKTDLDSIPAFVMKQIAEDKSRAITFMQTELIKPLIVNVSSRLLTLEIKDYMRPDNDTISIYYNRSLVVNRLGIGKQTFLYPVKIERQSGLNEIILYANNLGEVPPNTSELIIRDGTRAQRINIESTKQTSAVIYLRYSP